MPSIILDCDLMKFPNSGLYHYCKNLGYYVNKRLQELDLSSMGMYMPPETHPDIKDKRHAIVEKSWHRLWKPFLFGCRVWHAPFQSGRMLPNKVLYKHIRTVLTIHDLNVLHEGGSPEEQMRNIGHVQRLIDQSDAVVCISAFTKSDVERHCDVGGRPLHVISNGMNELAVPSLPREAYRPSRPFLFGIGYVNAKKNYAVLVQLLAQVPDLEIVVAGRLDDPDYVSRMKAEIVQLGLEDRFHLLGPVSEEAKSWYFQHCRAFVHPSLAEGFGLPVLEAMSVGKPVFISDRTSLPEIGGEAAFYFNTFEPEAMKTVLEDGLRRFGEEGRSALVINRAREFSWEQSAEDYIKIYKALL